ncbi:DEAD/DEAH box helicase [Coprococcus comes]|uniref:DEAD/DEAH box helicase n=2 Tax=Lachnospiraceae TaxID=186803 RepID=UPI00189F1AB9|nr:helicase-related protein [Coprococcus comes]
MERRKLTKEDIDKVRNIEGFPIGTDEDIIALSDAPFYTACPNPFIEDFIKEYGTPYDEATDDYHREPFAADVSEGKTDPIYMAHTYHTKVPHKAIMQYILHYTKPGDLVLDGFCGTGMTGVAAQMCGCPDNDFRYKIEQLNPNVSWGARKAILNDLSPSATFIASNYNAAVNGYDFSEEAHRIVDAAERELGWMYSTHPIQENLLGEKAVINYTLWSDVFYCPHCGREIVFWNIAIDSDGNMKKELRCDSCGSIVKKSQCAKVEKYNEERIYSIINSGWDLIIIDEAHRVAGSSGEVARYKLGNLLAQASPYLLLLSATPHNGKTEPFLRLIRLLDADAFPNAKSIVREQVAPFLIRTEKREAIDNNGNLLFKNRITHLVTISWDERNNLQRELYEMVSSYVAKTYNKALRNRKKNMCLIFLLIIMQRMVTSSTAAIRQSLERRLNVLLEQRTCVGNLREEDLDELNIEDGVEDALEAISLDMELEIEELKQIISLAKQAQFQNQDAKVEPLLNEIDAILSEDRTQKVIIFTEFVATQTYLQELLVNRGYTVTILNGGMSIDERNAAMQEFKTSTSIFISTDAGGEGLNLQFANIIINYDLPWNPMKIEQRCGRVDRIGQQRDVHIYNFIVGETVENRVREVLEEKLSVILKEMGVDKYSDVLDSEVAECDFTDVYMRSIGHASQIEKNLYPVEAEMKQQLTNAQKYKDVIREEKDLTKLVGTESNFDVDSALRTMLTYYECWQGHDPRLIDRISIADEEITQHLKTELVQDRTAPLMSIRIDNFPNEEGYFMLWELSISEKESGKRILPIFVNSAMILRPMAGKRIMDVFLDGNSKLRVSSAPNVDAEIYSKLEKSCMDFAYDTFVELKEKQMQQNEESFKKYMYALELRQEAAEHIGIENIRRSRLQKLQKEKANIEAQHRKGSQVYPDFRLIMMARLEA